MTIAELGHFIICYVQHVMSLSIIEATQRAQKTSRSEQHFIYIVFAGSIFLLAGPTGQETPT